MIKHYYVLPFDANDKPPWEFDRSTNLKLYCISEIVSLIFRNKTQKSNIDFVKESVLEYY